MWHIPDQQNGAENSQTDLQHAFFEQEDSAESKNRNNQQNHKQGPWSIIFSTIRHSKTQIC